LYYGLLLNIDGSASSRLVDILSHNVDAARIIRTKHSGNKVETILGFMQWNSLTHNFEYSNLGQMKSISALSDSLLKDFS